MLTTTPNRQPMSGELGHVGLDLGVFVLCVFNWAILLALGLVFVHSLGHCEFGFEYQCNRNICQGNDL